MNIRKWLFDILKDIIDGEWGPYDDQYYWDLVDTHLQQLIHKETGL